jgi:hypothetical protein
LAPHGMRWGSAGHTRLWQLDAKDPDQAALPRKWAKGRSSRQSCIGWRQHRVPAEFRCSALGRSWHLCDIAKSRMDVRFRGLTRTLSGHRRRAESDRCC